MVPIGVSDGIGRDPRCGAVVTRVRCTVTLGTAPPEARLDALLTAARRRLRWRAGVAAAAFGLHAGCWLAVPAAVVGWFAAGTPGALVGASAVAVAAASVGGLVGLARTPLDRRSTALVLDRLTGTDELLLAAVHAVDHPDRNRDEILSRLDQVTTDASALGVRRPRHLRWAPVPLALAAALVVALPRLPDARAWLPHGEPDPVVEVGAELRDRLERPSPDGVELPPELRRDLESLAGDLEGGELTQEEARERLAEMQRQLDELQRGLSANADLTKDLEEAAAELREQAPALSEELREGDLPGAADAARDLAQKLSTSGTPAERQEAGRAMKDAGSELQSSSDPSLQKAGEALEQAGEQLAEGGQLSPEQQESLARDLQQAREVGEQLARDRAAMKQSQEAAAAVEAARQRLGGEASVEERRRR
jgi:hypothetical protein